MEMLLSRALGYKKVNIFESSESFIERVQQLRLGDGLLPTTDVGPLINEAQLRRVHGYTEIARQEGAKILTGGQIYTEGDCANGFFYAPTIFADVTPDMRIAQEEIFGPVAAVLTFKNIEEAVEIANDSLYGLAASVWTKNIDAAHKAARDLQSGVVWVNCFDHGDMTMQWGGYKQSGQGRDKCFESMLLHTQTKSVWIHLD